MTAEVEPGPRCADPSARGGAPFAVQTFPYVEPRPWDDVDGGGVGVADLDGDGRLDALVLGHDREELILQRAPGVFVAVEDGYLAPGVDLSLGFGAVPADTDRDGDTDLFVTRYGAPNVLLVNDGTGAFTDGAAAAGLQGPPDHLSASATFADVDNDGDLDLYVAGHGPQFAVGEPEPPAHPDLLYLARGDGTFEDASDRVPERIHRGRGFVPLFLDLDDDGWRDLFVATDTFVGVEVAGALAWNRGGTFVLDDNASGLDLRVAAMGIGVGDVDGDGSWDLAIPAWGFTELLLRSPLGPWVDHADARGLSQDRARAQVVGWGTELADLDNDTRLDVVTFFGTLRPDLTSSPPGQPDGLWLQGEDGTFRDVAPAWGFDDPGIARGGAVVDLDRDGWLDVLLPRLDGPTRLYRAACGSASWVEVSLAWPGTANPDAIGAVVEATVGGEVLRRPVLAGGTGLGVGLPPMVHLGLGEAEEVEELRIRWPDGVRSSFRGVPARSSVRVTREDVGG